MNSLGLATILRMGCLCAREKIVINGRVFFVRERLAEGGFSTVDLIEDPRSHEEFALKRITCHSTEDQRIAMAEVEYHRLVNHPGIIEVIDYDLRGRADALGNTSSEVLVVLPYYHRGTLAAELERRERNRQHLSESEVFRLFHSICDATLAFHLLSPPLAHRDLKTANVLLDNNFQPIIMDLGSVSKARMEVHDAVEARRVEDTAAERSSMPYRAPELFNVQSQSIIDERTDVWSLGCILYALCFFKSPYDVVYERGDSVALAVVSGRIDIPANSPYNEDMHDLIRYILVLDPKERPYLQDVIQKAKQVVTKQQGCL